MKEKISAAADALNAAETKKEIGGRTLGSRTKAKEETPVAEDTFVKLGEFIGDTHNFKSSLIVKPQRKRLLETEDQGEEFMTLSCKAVNYLSLVYKKEEILAMLLETYEETAEIVKDIIIKDNSILVILNKSEIVKTRKDENLLDQSLNYIERYLKENVITDELMDLTVNGTLDVYGEEFAIELGIPKFITTVLAPRLVRLVSDDNAHTVLKKWALGKHEVRNDIMAVCFIVAPSDNEVTFQKKNFVGLQATLSHEEFSNEFKGSFKEDKETKVVFKRISNVLNNVPKSSATTKYVLKGSDSSAEITCVPLVEFERARYQAPGAADSNNWFLKSLAVACNTTTQLNEGEIRRYFGELINESVVIFGVEGESKSFLLPDIYKIAQKAVLGKVDSQLKTSVRVNDSLISMTLHI